MRTFIPMLLAFVLGFFAVRQVSKAWLQPEPLLPVPAQAIADTTSKLPAAPAVPAPVEEVTVAPAPEPSVAAVPADPQAELASAVTDLHDRLQAGNTIEAIMQYMPPSMRKSMPPERLAEVTKLYDGADQPGTIAYERVQYLIRVLHSLEGAEPVMNNVADIATFRVTVTAPEMIGRGPTTIKFYLEDGRWYLR